MDRLGIIVLRKGQHRGERGDGGREDALKRRYERYRQWLLEQPCQKYRPGNLSMKTVSEHLNLIRAVCRHHDLPEFTSEADILSRQAFVLVGQRILCRFATAFLPPKSLANSRVAFASPFAQI